MSDCTDCERLRKSIKEKDLKLSELEKQIKEYEIKIKELNDQKVKEKDQAKKKLDREVKQHKKEIEKRKEEKIQLEKEIGKLRETIEENQTKMKELKDGCKLDDTRKLKQKIEEYREAFEWNEEENQKLKEENKKLRINSKGNEVIQNKPKLFLGQICCELQDNFYRYVMPEGCCSGGYWHTIKDLEKDIEDESLFKGEERKKAQRKFEELKKEIDWKELHENVLLTIKRLKGQRNETAHPRVNEKEVRDAANTLNEQGQLRGRTAFDRVQQVIEIWLTSKSLLGGQHKPKSN